MALINYSRSRDPPIVPTEPLVQAVPPVPTVPLVLAGPAVPEERLVPAVPL